LASFSDNADFSADIEECGSSHNKYTGADHWVGDDGGSCTYRTGAEFTISTLPATDTVSQVDFEIEVTALIAFTSSLMYIGGYGGDGQGDLTGDTAVTAYANLDVAADHYVSSSAFQTTGIKSITALGSGANSDVEVARDAGTIFIIALQTDTEQDANINRADVSYDGGTNPPKLTITHSSPNATGTIDTTDVDDTLAAAGIGGVINVFSYVNTNSTAGGDGTTNATTGANRAYASRDEWNTNEAKDLVAAGEIHYLECDGTGGDDTVGFTTSASWNTSANYYVSVTNVIGYQLRAARNFAKMYQVNINYYREDGFIGEHLSTTGNTSNNDSVLYVDPDGGASSDVRFTNTHILGAAREGIIHAGGVGIYSNVLIEDCDGVYGFFSTYNSSDPTGTVLRHATVINSGTTEAIGTFAAAYLTAKNCYAHDNGATNGSYGSNVQTNYITCAASDTTGSSGALDSVAFSTVNFENVTAGSEDLHIKTGSNLNGGGTDISGDSNWLSTDLDGIDWETTPSVGVYEVVAGATTGTIDTTDVDDTTSSAGTQIFVGTLNETDINDTIAANGTSFENATGTIDVTDVDDTTSSAGTQIYIGTLNETDVDDTTASAGTEIFTGTLNTSDTDDTIAATGKSTYEGTLVETDVDDVMSASGELNTIGTINVTDTDDIIAGLGEQTFVGTSNTIDVDDTSSTSGQQTFVGTLNETDVDDTTSSAGTQTFVGTSNTTDADDTIAANGELSIAGTLNITDENDTLAAVGSDGSDAVGGTLNTADVDDTSSTAGNVVNFPIGTIDITDVDDTTASAGTEIFTGTLNTSDVDDTLAGVGAIGDVIFGTLNETDVDDTIAANGTETIVGALAETDTDDTTSSAGELTIAGTLNETDIDDTLAGVGNSADINAGTLNVTDTDDALAGVGNLPIAGTLNTTDEDDTSESAGIIVGVVVGTLDTTDDNDTTITFGFTDAIGGANITEQDDVMRPNGVGNVINLPTNEKSTCEITRPLLAKTVEKFYVSFFDMSENISNILGREVMSLERPNLTFNEFSIHNKGKRWTNGARIEYQPLTIIFFDDDKSLVNNALTEQLRKQSYELDSDNFKFSISTKIFTYNSNVAEKFTLNDCHIQAITQTESTYLDSTISTISVTITYNKLCYEFPKLDAV